jgi:hypothetical protein
MKNYTLFFLSISIFTYSCTSSSVDENKALQDSVIAVHDEVMPLMGTFVRNSIKIDSILINLHEVKQQNSALDTANIRAELLELKRNLDSSSESMTDWMHEFEVDHEGKSKEEIKEYLKSELVKIKEVKDKFESTFEESKAKLKDFEN